MGASCAIGSVCSLEQEAMQYVERDVAQALVGLTTLNSFYEAKEQYGNLLQYHDDGSPTFKSMKTLLNLSTDFNWDSRDSFDQKDIKFDKLIDTNLEVITKNKLGELAKQINIHRTVSVQDSSVGNLSYDQAQQLATLFNLQNADQSLIAVPYTEKIRFTDKYKVKLVKNTPDNQKDATKRLPQYAAINTLVSIFRRAGVLVDFDQFNKQLAGVIFQEEGTEYDENNNIVDTINTILTICTNGDGNKFEDIPKQINKNVALAAARVLMIAFKNKEETSDMFDRLYKAAERYNETNGLRVTTEKTMENFLAAEIESRINEASKKQYGQDVRRVMEHGRVRARRFLNAIANIFKNIFQNKEKISTRKVQAQARKAVSDMFKNPSQLRDGLQNSTPDGRIPVNRETPSERKNKTNLRTYKTWKSRVNTKEFKTALEVLDGIESTIKKYISIIDGANHQKTLTTFENLISMLNQYQTQGSREGGFSVASTDVSRAVVQVLQQLRTELLDASTDLEAAKNKLFATNASIQNKEYIEQIKEIQAIQERLNIINEVYVTVSNATQPDMNGNSLINAQIQMLGDNGIEVVDVGRILDLMSMPIEQINRTMESINNQTTIDLLVETMGRDSVNIVVGKIFTRKARARIENIKETAGYFETRDLVQHLLSNYNNLTNNWWQRRFGSIQNSASLLNQVVALAINQANTQSQNRTEISREALTEARRYFSDQGVSVDDVIEREGKAPTCNLIRPVDYAKYEKELAEAERQWEKEFAEKYDGEELSDEQDAILWKHFRQKKFNEWNKVVDPDTGKVDYKYKKQQVEILDPFNITYKDGEPQFQITTVDVYAPNIKMYKNQQWETWSNSGHEGLVKQRMSNFFFSMKYFSNLKLDGQGAPLHKLPYFRGSRTDRMWRNSRNIGVVAANDLKRAFLADLEDRDFGAERSSIRITKRNSTDYSRVGTESNMVKRIPLYGIRELENPRDISTDLFSSYLAYNQMANEYEAKRNIEGLVRNVSSTTSAGLDESSKDGNKTKNEVGFFGTYTFKEELERYIDKELYGLKKDDLTLGGMRVSIAKCLNWLGRFTTNLFLGGNVHSAFVNLITGWNEITKEAGVGQHFTIGNFLTAQSIYMHQAQAKKFYIYNDHHFFPHWYRHPNESPSVVNQVLKEFNFTERYIQDIHHYNTREWRIVRALKPEKILMMPYEITDHWMQSVPLIALMLNEKVYARPTTAADGKTKVAKQINLLEATHPEYKKIVGGGKWAREHTKKSPYIDTGNPYGLFYKTSDGAIEGEEILEILEPIAEYLKRRYSDPNAAAPRLEDLIQPEQLREVLGRYGIGDNFETVEDYQKAHDKLKARLTELLYNNADLASFRLKAREIVNRMHGVYDTQSKGTFNKTLLGALTLSMKNYAVGLVNRRLMQGHYNLIMGDYQEGTLITTAKVVYSALSAAFTEARFMYATKALLSIISPVMFKNNNIHGKRLNLKTALLNEGFSESQVLNLKRNKMDIFKIFIWGALSRIIKGLSTGWFGGMDDDDPDDFFDATGLMFDKKISLADILSYKIFKEGGELYSDVVFSKISEDLDWDLEQWRGKGLDELDNMMLQYILDDKNFQNMVFLSFGKEKDKNEYDEIGEGLYGYLYAKEKEFFKQIVEANPNIPEEKLKEKYFDKAGRRKKNTKLRAILKAINSFYYIEEEGDDKLTEEELAKKKTNLQKPPKTKMQQFEKIIKEQKDNLKNLQFEYENVYIPIENADYNKYVDKNKKITVAQRKQEQMKKQKDELYKQIVQTEKWLSGANEIKQSYNLFSAERKSAQFQQWRKALYKEYNVKTDEELKAKFRGDVEATHQIREMLDTEKTMNSVIERGNQRVAKKEFQKNYFKEKHPNIYYALGVINYFTERALLEQESFIPGGDFIARNGGGLVTDLIFTNWLGKDKLPKQDSKFNAFNESANLLAIPAFISAMTAVSDMPAQWLGALRYDKDSVNRRKGELYTQLQNTTDYEARRIIQNQIDDLDENYKRSHAVNNSGKLKKDDPKAMKYMSFAPYLRTLYIMGFWKFMEDGDPEGGWKATEAFKSFWQKEDK